MAGGQERSILHFAKMLHAHVAELQGNPNGINRFHRRTSL